MFEVKTESYHIVTMLSCLPCAVCVYVLLLHFIDLNMINYINE